MSNIGKAGRIVDALLEQEPMRTNLSISRINTLTKADPNYAWFKNQLAQGFKEIELAGVRWLATFDRATGAIKVKNANLRY
jgi:hypothetical protein